MERLTEKITNSETGNVLAYRLKREVDRIKAITKLAEYEDAEEQVVLLRLPCKVGDTVWELCKCNDGVYRIFPMVVKQVIPYGAIRWVKGKEPSVWNIYAQSDYTDMYKRFLDIGKTVFLTKEKAKQALEAMKGGGSDAENN